MPTSDDYLAAGFTPEQVDQLHLLNLSVLEMISKQQHQFSELLNRLKPEAWLQ